MPDAAAQQSKRPSIGFRHSSSGSGALGRSPSEALSSSGQRSKSSRHVVGGSQLRGRVPSYTRTAAQKAAPKAEDLLTPAAAVIAAHKHDPIKRNLSNVHLARNNSSTALRKNHSETSLKRNRSGAQLVALAKLPHTGSSRHLAKNSKQGRPKKSSSNSGKHGDVATVRFALGDEDPGQAEDAWEEASASQSNPSTKPNTRRNSLTTETQDFAPAQPPVAREGEPPDPVTIPAALTQPSPPSPRTPSPVEVDGPAAHDINGVQQLAPASEPPRPRPASRTSERNSSITHRLLQRNVSFTVPPELSSVSASVAGSTHTSPNNTRHGNSEIVSRFINGISSSGTTKSSYLAQHQLSHYMNEEDERIRKNSSAPNFAKAPLRASSSLSGSGAVTPTTEWNQQENEAPTMTSPPKASGRRVRLSTTESIAPMPTTAQDAYSGISDFASDQSEVEYRRIRVFHNPLAESIERVNLAKPPPKPSAANKAPAKPSLLPSTWSNGNEPRSSFGLSTSWRSQKSEKSGKSSSVETVRKPRVMFQGLNDKGGGVHAGSGRGRSLDDDEETKMSPREEIREVCKRMWNRDAITQGQGGDD